MLSKYSGRVRVKHLMSELILLPQPLAGDEVKIMHQLGQSSHILIVFMFLLTLFSSYKYQINMKIKHIFIFNNILVLLQVLCCSLFAMLLGQKQDLFTLRACCLYPTCSHNSSIMILQQFHVNLL